MKKLHSIMLVDDDPTTNFINELLINEMAITEELLVASNGKEALETLNEHFIQNDYLPDLILLDINMPVMDGFDFLMKFNELNKKNTNCTIVVMLTTSLNPGDIKKAKDLKVKDYISKPLLEERLQEILERHL